MLLRVANLIRNPATSALQLASAILEDQALTARLLRLVNSPFYGFPRQIATVTETLTILGFRPVQHLLLTATVVDLLQAEETPEFSPVGLWQHAVGTAVAARLLARTAGYEAHEAVFVAGLLHDVGKLIQHQCLRPEFLEALALARDGDLPLHEAETRVWGFDHTQVGRALLLQLGDSPQSCAKRSVAITAPASRVKRNGRAPSFTSQTSWPMPWASAQAVRTSCPRRRRQPGSGSVYP